MSRSISAPVLRIILVLLVVVAFGAGVGGFVYLRSELLKKAQETANLSREAENSRNNQQLLIEAQKNLASNDQIVTKVREMVAQSQSYQYQDDIISDLYIIANASGVKVSSIDFPSSQGSSSSSQKTTQGALATGTNLPSDIKQTTANLTIVNPVRYDNLLTFIKRLELNNRKMQVARVSLSAGDSTENGFSLVTCETFTIGVYIR